MRALYSYLAGQIRLLVLPMIVLFGSIGFMDAQTAQPEGTSTPNASATADATAKKLARMMKAVEETQARVAAESGNGDMRTGHPFTQLDQAQRAALEQKMAKKIATYSRDHANDKKPRQLSTSEKQTQAQKMDVRIKTYFAQLSNQ